MREMRDTASLLAITRPHHCNQRRTQESAQSRTFLETSMLSYRDCQSSHAMLITDQFERQLLYCSLLNALTNISPRSPVIICQSSAWGASKQGFNGRIQCDHLSTLKDSTPLYLPSRYLYNGHRADYAQIRADA